MDKHSNQVVKAGSEVIGVNVKNDALKDLGKIEEVVLDKLSGEARYVVLSFGGILGMGDKLFALPWHTLRFSPENNCFILNVTKEKLEKAPGFDKNHWPDMANHVWAQGITDYYRDTLGA